jgi:predicted RecB family nuclease
MELSTIKGLGPAKQEALRQAGIGSVEDLASLDLRRNVEVKGVTQDALKGLKQGARRALAAEGKPVPKAQYRRDGKTTPTKTATRKTPKPVPEQDIVVAFGEKRGFLRRILSRRS